MLIQRRIFIARKGDKLIEAGLKSTVFVRHQLSAQNFMENVEWKKMWNFILNIT